MGGRFLFDSIVFERVLYLRVQITKHMISGKTSCIRFAAFLVTGYLNYQLVGGKVRFMGRRFFAFFCHLKHVKFPNTSKYLIPVRFYMVVLHFFQSVVWTHFWRVGKFDLCAGVFLHAPIVLKPYLTC